MKKIRKTKKYYREELAKVGFNMTSLKFLLIDILTKYCKEKWHEGEFRAIGEFKGNHRLEGFLYSKKSKKLLINLYWQGDDTDGNEYIEFDKFLYTSFYTIPAKTEFYNNRTYYKHGDITIEREEILALIPFVIDHLKKK